MPESFVHQALVGVLPHGQLDFEGVYVAGAERRHQTSVSPTQEQQVCIKFCVVAEGEGRTLRGFYTLVFA